MAQNSWHQEGRSRGFGSHCMHNKETKSGLKVEPGFNILRLTPRVTLP